MHEAILWETLGNGKIRCNICPRRCWISPGHTGVCRTRLHRDGKLYTTIYGLVSSIATDPMREEAPLSLLSG